MPVKKVVNPRRRSARQANGRFRLKKRSRPKLKARVNRPRRKVTAKAKRHVRNPSLVLMGLNPVRGRSHSVAKKRTHRLKKRTNRHHLMKAHSNPSRRHRRLAVKKNPFGFSTPLFLETAGWAIVGGVATRVIPQQVAPNANTGPVGYAMNAFTAAGLSFLAGKYKREAGLGVALGGTVMIVGRVVSDYFGKNLVTFSLLDQSTSIATPVGVTAAPSASTQLSQGDLHFDLRNYKGTYFPLPSSTTGKGLTSPPPWQSDLSKLKALIPPAKGSTSGPTSKNIPSKPTSLKGGRYSVM